MNDPRRPSDLAPRASLSGRAAFVSLLASEGIDVMFGNPGTTELAIMEALGQQSHIQYVLGLQEAHRGQRWRTATLAHPTGLLPATCTSHPDWATPWARCSTPSSTARRS